jgi:hypothetical protein
MQRFLSQPQNLENGSAPCRNPTPQAVIIERNRYAVVTECGRPNF